LAGAALGGDGLFQSFRPHVVQLEIPLARLPQAFDGFTIAQMSDFHFQHDFSEVPIRKAVEIVNGLNPHIMALTGDFVTVPVYETSSGLRRAALTATPCAAILQSIRAPKYAILGNHDVIADPIGIVRTLQDHGIPVLRNRSLPLEMGAERIWLAGLDDLLRGAPNLGTALRGIPPNEATILMAHEPDSADQAQFAPVDLQLSGHSHGGQIWIPGVGAPWLPALAKKYPRGLYKIGNLTLYTNFGIGTILAPVRINAPPEITLITLRSARA
jgi:uncharacterized protein